VAITAGSGESYPADDFYFFSTLTIPSFGHGRQACPGRFFAVRLLKTVIAEIIMRYDLRFSAGIQTRPESLDWEPICPPDTSLILEFRSREEQRQQ
jgi:cytochrome P450